MAAPLILAQTMLDAHKFAREELGLAKGHYRVVTSPSSISGRRGADLYLVPGYEKRYDRFKMAGALKYTRLNKIDVAELRQNAVPDNLEPAGLQLSLVTQEEANAFLMISEGGPIAPEPESVEAPAKRRRRSRCKNCSTLHFKDDFCPSEPLPVG